MSTPKDTAKKAAYAALGVGSFAAEKAKHLPQQVSSFSSTVATRVTSRATTLRKNVKGVTVAPIRLEPERVRALVTDSTRQAIDLTESTRKQAQRLFTDLAKRGQKVAKRVQRSSSTKQAVTRPKQARSSVKAATTSVRKAAQADVGAARDAVVTSVEQTG